jgi:glycosyltransferase involved in cell wall biosynthesis
MLWVFPIEPIEERYSAQWARWWQRELARLRVPHRFVMPWRDVAAIHTGQFLDTRLTHKWKANQLAMFVNAILEGEVQDGDWVILHDAWNPMLESLAYIRDTEGPKFKIAGLFHAGTYDPHDYLAQKGLGRWAGSIERGWLEALDRVFVATDYHAALINHPKAEVTGFPFYIDEFARHFRPWAEREKLVVFPHRLAPEKQPAVFDQVRELYARRYPSDAVRWVRTQDVCKSKDDYYSLLGSARVSFSAALQETWGIAMLESLALGAWPVAPARLSYPETVGWFNLYPRTADSVDMIHARLHETIASPFRYPEGENAIAAMIAAMPGVL